MQISLFCAKIIFFLLVKCVTFSNFYTIIKRNRNKSCLCDADHNKVLKNLIKQVFYYYGCSGAILSQNGSEFKIKMNEESSQIQKKYHV